MLKLNTCAFLSLLLISFSINADKVSSKLDLTSGLIEKWRSNERVDKARPLYSLERGFNKINGENALKLKYSFPEKDSSYISLVFHLPKPIDISKYEKIIFYAYSSEKKQNPVTLYLKSVDGFDVGFRAFSFIPDFEGWKKIEFKIDEPKYTKGTFNRKSLARVDFIIFNDSVSQKESTLMLGPIRLEDADDEISASRSSKTQDESSSQNAVKYYFIGQTQNAPSIDGNFDDEAWGNAAWREDFLSAGDRTKAAVKTAFKAVCDNENLYLAIRCEEPSKDKIRKEIDKDGIRDIWTDDNVEIFLDMNNDKKDYFQIAVNSLGKIYSEHYFSPKVGDADWNGYFEAKASDDSKSWQVELKLPLKNLVPKPLSSGDQIGLNLDRTRYTQNPKGEFFSWNFCGKSFHNPELFGKAICGKAVPLFKKRYAESSKALCKIKEKLNASSMSPKKRKAFEDKLEDIDLRFESVNSQNGTPGDISFQELENIADKINSLEDKLRLQDVDFLLWGKSPFESLTRNKIPRPVKKLDGIKIKAGKNEIESSSFVISNFTENPICARIILSDIINNKTKDRLSPNNAIKLRTSFFSVLRDKRVIADALPELDEANALIIPSGENREVFIALNSSVIPPGKYFCFLEVKPFSPELKPETVKLDIEILPIAFGNEKPLNVNVYEYFKSQEFERWQKGKKGGELELMRRKAEIPISDYPIYLKDMAAHGVNVFTVPVVFPEAKLDKSGNMIEPYSKEDIEIFRKFLSIYKSQKRAPLLVNLYRGYLETSRKLKRLGHKFMGEKWKEFFTEWFKSAEKNLNECGYPPGEWFVYMFDEVHGDAPEKAIAVYQLIKEISPKTKIFQTVGYNTKYDDIKKVAPYVNIFQAHILHRKTYAYLLQKKFVDLMKSPSREVWFYNNLLAKKFTSPSVVRMQPLLAWKYDLSGVGFWSYSRFIGDPWDDFDYRDLRRAPRYSDCLMVYPGKNGPVPSRRWEAFRDGLEDYKYIRKLESLVQKAKDKGVNADLSQKLLNEFKKKLSREIDLKTQKEYRDKALDQILLLKASISK